MGAATTIAVLVASQLIGGLVLDIFRSHGVPLRTLFGPICGAILLVVGALVGSQTLILITGWCRLWLTVHGALPYLLYACDRDEQ